MHITTPTKLVAQSGDLITFSGTTIGLDTKAQHIQNRQEKIINKY